MNIANANRIDALGAKSFDGVWCDRLKRMKVGKDGGNMTGCAAVDDKG